MTKHYLELAALNKVFKRLAELKQWNLYLADCLVESKEEGLLEHCQIVNLIGTSLITVADSAQWVTRFRFQIPDLLKKLKKYPEFAHLKAIDCKIRPNYTPHSLYAAREPQKSLSAKNAALLQETANKIPDEKLSTILKRIARHHMKA